MLVSLLHISVGCSFRRIRSVRVVVYRTFLVSVFVDASGVISSYWSLIVQVQVFDMIPVSVEGLRQVRFGPFQA